MYGGVCYEAGAPSGARFLLTQAGFTGTCASAFHMPLLRSSFSSWGGLLYTYRPYGAQCLLVMAFITGRCARKVLPLTGQGSLDGRLFYRYAAPPGPGGPLPAIGQVSPEPECGSLHWHICTLTHSLISSVSSASSVRNLLCAFAPSLRLCVKFLFFVPLCFKKSLQRSYHPSVFLRSKMFIFRA